jgi:hypothetical protein
MITPTYLAVTTIARLQKMSERRPSTFALSPGRYSAAESELPSA